MLRYLPIPRPDELLYSIFARYAVHAGIVSPKQCLDDLFNCRTVVATVDLPSHLDAFLNNAAHLWDISIEDLIYRHTLFPLYAPFVPDERRHVAMSHMRSSKGGAQHMELGVAASIVKPPIHMQYCPTCLIDLQIRYGEYFWPRAWQVAGVNVCALHGPLVESAIRFRPTERHRFIPATPSSFIASPVKGRTKSPHRMEWAVCSLANQLLAMPPQPSPTYYQWSQFYHDIATQHGFTRGKHVVHSDLHRKLQSIWNGCELNVVAKIHSWLPSLFRKHRKSFSYVQHLIVWAALAPGMPVKEILRCVSNLPLHPMVPVRQKCAPLIEAPAIAAYRDLWRQVLTRFNHRGAKWIRENRPGMAATYAWLYRHDRQWLLSTNKQNRLKHTGALPKVNWKKRDLVLSRKLQNIANKNDSNSARRTRTWLINQLPHCASVSKNLGKLPLCDQLLSEISESVADYQIRRCKYAIEELNSKGMPISRWRIERQAGISPTSIRTSTERFLMSLNGAACGQNDHQTNPQ